MLSHLISGAIFIPAAIFTAAAAVTSLRENEKRAGLIFILFTLLPVCIMLFSFPGDRELFRWISIATAILFLLPFILPFPGKTIKKYEVPGERFHEADSVLSRRLLQQGSEVYDTYYKEHPGFRKADDKARANPGLLSDQAKYYDPQTFSASKANFSITDELPVLSDIMPAGRREDVNPESEAAFIMKWLVRTGAHDVGFTALQNHHLYSHKGRGKRNGEKIDLSLPLAIVIITEMDHRMMQAAPEGPTVMESSEQYLHSGILATKLAVYIRNRGYQAVTHTDGNYEVICPLVAQDAGLGVIGRMGLLMTPRLGPRVRISVVTTDLPLSFTERQNNYAPVAFCKICKKCASNCPARAIPPGDMQTIHGVKRWRINSEKCYHYWTVSGTDCGRCVITCPYSHPDNWLHRFTRKWLKNNLLFRNAALKLDDIFYGRHPRVKPHLD